MAQNKITDNIVSDADMSLNGKIVFPENDSNKTHLSSEKSAYNVTVFETNPSSIGKDELIYKPTYNIKDNPIKSGINFYNISKKIFKFSLKYMFMHLSHPIMMLIADITIVFFVAPLFIGYTNSVYLVSNLMQSFVSNPIVIAVASIGAIIFLAPFIFGSSDFRSEAEKKEDARVDRLLNRIYR